MDRDSAGQHADQIEAGRIATRKFIRLATDEYFEPLGAGGLKNRATRTHLPAIVEQVAA